VQSVAMPITGARQMSLPAQNPLLAALYAYEVGAPTSAGLLTRSYDGRFVSLVGVNTGVGSAFQPQALASGVSSRLAVT
jgi:hypothetical protein